MKKDVPILVVVAFTVSLGCDRQPGSFQGYKLGASLAHSLL
jgi:hypothetical protein